MDNVQKHNTCVINFFSIFNKSTCSSHFSVTFVLISTIFAQNLSVRNEICPTSWNCRRSKKLCHKLTKYFSDVGSRLREMPSRPKECFLKWTAKLYSTRFLFNDLRRFSIALCILFKGKLYIFLRQVMLSILVVRNRRNIFKNSSMTSA
jgi:hypothetical protein